MGLSDEDDEEPNVKKQKRVRETPSVTFDDLPIDILGVIFKYFNILELFRLQLVAKRWQIWCWRFQTLLDFRLINKELTDKHLEPILSKVQNLLRYAVRIISDPIAKFILKNCAGLLARVISCICIYR